MVAHQPAQTIQTLRFAARKCPEAKQKVSNTFSRVIPFFRQCRVSFFTSSLGSKPKEAVVNVHDCYEKSVEQSEMLSRWYCLVDFIETCTFSTAIFGHLAY